MVELRAEIVYKVYMEKRTFSEEEMTLELDKARRLAWADGYRHAMSVVLHQQQLILGSLNQSLEDNKPKDGSDIS